MYVDLAAARDFCMAECGTPWNTYLWFYEGGDVRWLEKGGIFQDMHDYKKCFALDPMN